MVLNHTNGGARPRQSRYRAMALTRTTDGAHRSQYSLQSKSDIESLERTYAEVLGCPVKVEFGTVTPA